MTEQSTEPKAFDPSKYLMKLKGKDYLEVKYRLQWLRTEHPEADIRTVLEYHHRDESDPYAVFFAEVVIKMTDSDETAAATGWGMEEKSDFTDYLEKAETKALGRALAALGYGTQFCDDWNFGADEGRVVDAPVAPRSKRVAGPLKPVAGR